MLLVARIRSSTQSPISAPLVLFDPKNLGFVHAETELVMETFLDYIFKRFHF
jgi:hypothetical protein